MHYFLPFIVALLASPVFAGIQEVWWNITYVHGVNPDGRYPRRVVGVNGTWPYVCVSKSLIALPECFQATADRRRADRLARFACDQLFGPGYDSSPSWNAFQLDALDGWRLWTFRMVCWSYSCNSGVGHAPLRHICVHCAIFAQSLEGGHFLNLCTD